MHISYVLNLDGETPLNADPLRETPPLAKISPFEINHFTLQEMLNQY